MGFNRRFVSRVGSDEAIGPGHEHMGEEIPTLSARIEEKQKSRGEAARPNNTNKIFPKDSDLELCLVEERQRQSKLQKKICIFLCTVLPLVTTGATLHRLWFTGLLSFKERSDEQECPVGWVGWSSSCYRHLPAPETWSAAQALCLALGSSLADITSKAESSFLANMTSGLGESWTGGRVEGGAWSWDGGAEWTADLAPPPHPGHCLLLGLGGGWGGAPCHQERGALCEMQPGLELPEELVTGPLPPPSPPTTSTAGRPCSN